MARLNINGFYLTVYFIVILEGIQSVCIKEKVLHGANMCKPKCDQLTI